MATPNDPRQVLIVDPAFLGDAVFDAALARAVKQRWPEAEVGLVVRPPAQHLGPFMTYVDRVHLFDKRGQDQGWTGLKRMAARLAELDYDLALVPHPSLRSTWLTARAGIARRVGSTEGWFARRFLTEHREIGSGDGFVKSRLRLLGDDAEAPTLKGVLHCEVSQPDSGPARIGLVLGSEWATKRWPVRHAATWVRTLNAATQSVVLLGSASETPLFDELRAALAYCSVTLHDQVGGSIDDLVRQIASCQALIAGDTGPLHIARALGVPTVALFGPTDDALHQPSADDRVLTVPVDCRPCSPHGHRQCPKGHHRCLEDLGPESVQAALTEIGGRM